MYNFDYVNSDEVRSVREELSEIIYEVQSLVQNSLTFQAIPVGSSSINMVTCDKNSNIGFDFDFDLEINDNKGVLEPKAIRHLIRNALNQAAPKYGYKYCEDSTRVLTIKKVDTYTCKIMHSCDFALIRNCDNGKQQYIRFNKKNNNYTWEFQSKGFKNYDTKIQWLKANNYWEQLRNYYLHKKNINNNPHKHSRSILVESVNEMYQRLNA